MVQVIVLPEAERDLAEAFAWYEEQRPGLGGRFLDEASRTLERIGQLPRAFPAVEEVIRRAYLKRFPFAIYFLPDTGSVKVYAVLHHRLEPGQWKERLGL